MSFALQPKGNITSSSRTACAHGGVGGGGHASFEMGGRGMLKARAIMHVKVGF